MSTLVIKSSCIFQFSWVSIIKAIPQLCDNIWGNHNWLRITNKANKNFSSAQLPPPLLALTMVLWLVYSYNWCLMVASPKRRDKKHLFTGDSSAICNGDQTYTNNLFVYSGNTLIISVTIDLNNLFLLSDIVIIIIILF